MKLPSPLNIAVANLEHLAANPYPGRILFQGINFNYTHFVQGCCIMGRSESSRNRKFVLHEEGRVSTAEAVPVPGADLRNIIYDAMIEDGGNFVVSNGDHTNTIIKELICGGSFEDALSTREYEDDGDNNTPRIAGCISIDAPQKSKFAVLRKSPFGLCERDYFERELRPGFAYGIHTYQGDGTPLPAFERIPFILPALGTVKEIAQMIWENINQENKVAIAIKQFPIKGGQSDTFIINKNE